MPDLIFELGHEELPPSIFPGMVKYLEKDLKQKLQELRLDYSSLKVWYTCRRTVIMVEELPVKQPEIKKEITGPPKQILFKDDVPTPALTGFLKKYNASESQLTYVDKDKGTYAVLHIIDKGEKTFKILSELLPELIQRIPLPRTMIWDDSGIQFIRPVRNIFAMFGDKKLKLTIGNLNSKEQIIPNPVMGKSRVKIGKGCDYFSTLKSNQVILNPEERKGILLSRIKEILPSGLHLIEDPDLVTEIINIVENPIPIIGNFNVKYLSLPKNMLIFTLKKHQRYFTLENKDGNVVPQFIGVADGKREDYSHIRKGYEEVLVARLEDAHFFFEEDLKVSPDERIKKLKEVILLKGYGTLYDKTLRLQDLTQLINDETECSIDPENLKLASYFSRNDLLSNVITEKEYASLQGEMGSIYLKRAKYPEDVVQAVFEMYLPRFLNDLLPQTELGKILSIADRLDTLLVFFTAGKVPTGSADPFALRRAALGLIQVILDAGYDIQLRDILLRHFESLNHQKLVKDMSKPALEQIADNVLDFIKDRLRVYLSEEKGFSLEVINAIFVTDESSITRILAKIKALESLTELSDFDRIKVSFKRVMNIIDGDFNRVNESLLQEKEEQELYENFKIKKETIAQYIKTGGFEEVFKEFLSLRPYIDDFFDHVLVNCDDEQLRNNRMAMLSEIGGTFLQIANFKMIS